VIEFAIGDGLALDLLVKNGTIHDGVSAFKGAVGVAGSSIVARFADGEELPSALTIVDAHGCLVVPGIIDPHIHLYGDGMSGYSRLAARGGVTTSIAMIRGEPEEPLGELVDRHCREGRSGSLTDFSFHVVLHDRPDTIGQIRDLAAQGFRSFKMFLAYKERGMMASEAFLYAAMDEIARIGGVALVHCEDGELVSRLESEAKALGKTEPQHYAPTRPPEAEASAIAVVAMASHATGCPAYIVHVSSAEGLAAIQAARRRGVHLWAETCPQYVLLGNEDLQTHGPAARIAPPLRSPADRLALGAALASGEMNTVGTDHACYSKEAKAKGAGDIFAAPFGMPGAPLLWPSMFTWAKNNQVPASTLLRAMVHMPAAIFGLGHRKGTLAPGADADIVIVDPNTARAGDPDELWPDLSPNPLATEKMTGWPVTTISRGEIIWNRDEFAVDNGRGQLVEQRERHHG